MRAIWCSLSVAVATTQRTHLLTLKYPLTESLSLVRKSRRLNRRAWQHECLAARPDHETATGIRGEQYLLHRRLIDRREFEAMRLLAGFDVGVLGLVGAVLLTHYRRDLVGLRQVLRLVEIPYFDPGSS